MLRIDHLLALKFFWAVATGLSSLKILKSKIVNPCSIFLLERFKNLSTPTSFGKAGKEHRLTIVELVFSIAALIHTLVLQ